MHARRTVLTAVALIALTSAVGQAAEPLTVELKAADVLELAKRFAKFNDALPQAAKLGMSKLTAFEEHIQELVLLDKPDIVRGAGIHHNAIKLFTI